MPFSFQINNLGHADIWKWFTYMATDLIGVVAFGESFGLLRTEVVRARRRMIGKYFLC